MSRRGGGGMVTPVPEGPEMGPKKSLARRMSNWVINSIGASRADTARIRKMSLRKISKSPHASAMIGWSRLRLCMYDVVKSNFFNQGILTIILLNTACIVLQTVRNVGAPNAWWFDLSESIFLAIYVVEIALKFLVFRQLFFSSGWNTFDLIVVMVSFMELGMKIFVGSQGSFDPSVFRLVRVFKAIRGFRALRVLRTVTFFQKLQVVVSTLLKSIPAWGNISMLLFLVLYIFAIIGVSLYGEVNPERFGSMWSAMFALFQLITLDDWFEMYSDVKDKDATIVIYLILFIIVETFIFVNLFVAVIVNNLEQLHQKNEEVTDGKEKKTKRAPGKSQLRDTEARKRAREKREQRQQKMEKGGESGPIKSMREFFRDETGGGVCQATLTQELLMHLAALEKNVNDFQDSQNTLDKLLNAAATKSQEKMINSKDEEAGGARAENKRL